MAKRAEKQGSIYKQREVSEDKIAWMEGEGRREREEGGRQGEVKL